MTVKELRAELKPFAGDREVKVRMGDSDPGSAAEHLYSIGFVADATEADCVVIDAFTESVQVK